MRAAFSPAEDTTGMPSESSGEFDFGVLDFDLSHLLANHDQLDMFSAPGQSQPPGPNANSLGGAKSTADYGQLVQQSSTSNATAPPAQHSSFQPNHPPFILNSDRLSQTQIQILQQEPPVKEVNSEDQTALILKEQLARQIQLQKIQQLQNQLLQQQIDLISGGTLSAFSAMQAVNPGLLTPASSVTMSPASARSQFSPLILHQNSNAFTGNQDAVKNAYLSLVPDALAHAGHRTPTHRHPLTAPASMVFRNPGISSPREHFSPLTSPALEPVYNSYEGNVDLTPVVEGSERSESAESMLPPTPTSINESAFQNAQTRHSIKRRSSTDDMSQARKKQPSHIHPAMKRGTGSRSQVAPGTVAPSRPVRSRAAPVRSPVLLSSPLENATDPQIPAEEGDPVSQNTPSLVDLAMPPPVPPAPSEGQKMLVSSAIAPVTPRSLMNLDHRAVQSNRLVQHSTVSKITAVSPPVNTAESSAGPVTDSQLLPSGKRSIAARKIFPAGKKDKDMMTTALPSGSSSPSSASPISKPVSGPSLKRILPEGMSADAVSQLSLKSNYQNILEGRGQDLGLAFSSEAEANACTRRPPGSHRDAEKKRRDSLKAGFDDLRLLLPPVTFDVDPETGEAVPGSNPPRGPARSLPGVEDHPNRGVSKLALLRSSNEYVVRLKRRISRRDKLIEKMRLELRALRLELNVFGEEYKGMTLVDLDEDVDRIEAREDEIKSGKLAARPTERAKEKLLAAASANSSDSSGEAAPTET